MYLILNGMLWLLMRAISEEEYLEHMKVRVNRIPLDKRLSETLKGTKLDRTYMWELRIPREGRKALYEYIRKKGVNAASLFPGYGGVVKSIQEDKSF